MKNLIIVVAIIISITSCNGGNQVIERNISILKGEIKELELRVKRNDEAVKINMNIASISFQNGTLRARQKANKDLQEAKKTKAKNYNKLSDLRSELKKLETKQKKLNH